MACTSGASGAAMSPSPVATSERAAPTPAHRRCDGLDPGLGRSPREGAQPREGEEGRPVTDVPCTAGWHAWVMRHIEDSQHVVCAYFGKDEPHEDADASIPGSGA